MIEAMKQALEALEANQPVNYCMNNNGENFPMFKSDPLRQERNEKAITSLRQAIEQVEKQEIPYVLVVRDGSGKEVISSISPRALGHVKQYPKCNPHPKAPHGFDRNASHGADRYVCECESWDAYDAGIEEGMKRERALWEMAENARELGLDYEPAQEPVAWGMQNDDGRIYDCITPEEHARLEGEYKVPLYTTPQPKREWVGLTDEELKPLCDVNHIIFGAYTVDFVRSIEAKLKEKNT